MVTPPADQRAPTSSPTPVQRRELARGELGRALEHRVDRVGSRLGEVGRLASSAMPTTWSSTKRCSLTGGA